MLWSAPLQIGLSLYFLYNTLGPAVFSGVGKFYPDDYHIFIIGTCIHLSFVKLYQKHVI